jgi:hypothetical protein
VNEDYSDIPLKRTYSLSKINENEVGERERSYLSCKRLSRPHIVGADNVRFLKTGDVWYIPLQKGVRRLIRLPDATG